MIRPISQEEFTEIIRKRPYTSVAKDICEFADSADTVCEVDASNYKSARSASGSYKESIKRMKYDIDVITRGGRCFMVKKGGLA